MTGGRGCLALLSAEHCDPRRLHVLIHTELMARMQAKKIGPASIGLYIFAGWYCSENDTNGRISREALSDYLPQQDGDSSAPIDAELQKLIDAGFILEEQGDNLVLADWGEWVVGDGEAGQGAE